MNGRKEGKGVVEGVVEEEGGSPAQQELGRERCLLRRVQGEKKSIEAAHRGQMASEVA